MDLRLASECGVELCLSLLLVRGVEPFPTPKNIYIFDLVNDAVKKKKRNFSIGLVIEIW